ncbi:hypothetical protein [Desertivirga brevis]|uniref:hypothetical protein n=1 Tax=Desertivirga brevis TaxID=2810310 RepID=UPI001A973EF7|nr:hypothetical protein [Pedobacter sp. SYSU D00873]
MKKHNTYLIAFMLCLAACKNNEDAEPENVDTLPIPEVQSANEVIETERLVNELEFVARSIKTAYPNQPGILAGTTITEGKTSEGKKKYDIVFNNLNGPDNKKRNGLLTVVYEDAVENGNVVVGKHLHVRSDEEANLFSIDGVKFKGSSVFSNIEAAKASNAATINHLNAQSFIIKPDATQIRFSSVRKSKWISGSSTGDTNDDVFELSDQSYSLTIQKNPTSFIEVKPGQTATLSSSCTQSSFLPKKGKLKIEKLGGKTFYLSFGNGNCSDTVSLSYNMN